MSLQDTDPNTTNRIEPTPQAMDQNPTRSSDGTTAITNKQDGSSGAYVSTKDATVKVNDGTYNRVSMGLLPDGSYGLKVSKPDFDVLSAADDELVFNSSQNVFKIVDKFSQPFTLTSAATTIATTVTITHNLGYKPLIVSFVDITTLTNGTTGVYPVPVFVPGTGGGTTNVFVMLSYLRVMNVSNSTVSYDVGIQGGVQTFAGTITCYVLQETTD